MAAPANAARVDRPEAAIPRLEGSPLRFEAATQGGGKIELVPLNTLYDERYAVYWRFAG